MHMSFTPPEPDRAAGALAPGERLLLEALTAWAGAAQAAEARVAARAIAWRASHRVAAVFLAWIQAIEASRRRPIAAACPGCGGPSGDLRRLVAACGMSTLDAELGARLVAPLVSEPETVMVLARMLNRALAAAGWPLPARLGRGAGPH